jgi:hypothetical protein
MAWGMRRGGGFEEAVLQKGAGPAIIVGTGEVRFRNRFGRGW